jgi:hypothetical protein
LRSQNKVALKTVLRICEGKKDPDPGGPKTYGSYEESRSATGLKNLTVVYHGMLV